MEETHKLSWARLFRYISFRSGATVILSLIIAIFFGDYIIKQLRTFSIYGDVRDENIQQNSARKKNTPTMGGIIILIATLIPVLLFSSITNIYVLLLIFTILVTSILGFIDDYIKVWKKNKNGVKMQYKIIVQVMLGAVVGITLYFHPDVVIRKFKTTNSNSIYQSINKETNPSGINNHLKKDPKGRFYEDIKSIKTNIPFFKNNEFDYVRITKFFIPFFSERYTWILYMFLVIFIIAAVSNGANLTDGLDGLAASSSATIILTLAILAYLSGNVVFSQYLNILYIPGSGEIAIFCTALVGACIGFLWHNAYPASIFMGDTGSLMIGGVIAVISIAIRKELLIPLLCGIFFIECLSVILQVIYFKYTKKKSGVGKRLFKMAPIHHHFQQKGIHESKIVTRFFICGVILSIITLITLKIR